MRDSLTTFLPTSTLAGESPSVHADCNDGDEQSVITVDYTGFVIGFPASVEGGPEAK